MGKASRLRMLGTTQEIRIKLKNLNCIPNLNPNSSDT